MLWPFIFINWACTYSRCLQSYYMGT